MARPLFIVPNLPVGEQAAPLGRGGRGSLPRALDQSQRLFGPYSFGEIMVDVTESPGAWLLVQIGAIGFQFCNLCQKTYLPISSLLMSSKYKWVKTGGEKTGEFYVWTVLFLAGLPI